MPPAESPAVLRDERRQPQFGLVYLDELDHPAIKNLPPNAFRLWVALVVHASRDGTAWPGTQRLIDLCQTSPRTHARSLQDLRAAGLVSVGKTTYPGGWRNTYTLHSPPPATEPRDAS